MGIWPFGKKNDEEKKAQEKPAAQSEKSADPTSADAEAQETYAPVDDTAADAAAASGNEPSEFAHDAINDIIKEYDPDAMLIGEAPAFGMSER